MRDLQEHGFGEIKGSIALNSQQIQEILQHSRIDHSNLVNLLYRVFIRLSILLVMRGGEHYQLKVDQFKIDKHGGLQFFCYISKNNQHGLQKGQAQVISISLDTVGRCNDIKFYLSKRPSVSDPEFYLQPSSDWMKSDNDVPEQAIMQLTGHRSIQGIRAYKQ
ncbi:6538_t:CDS:2, partial [Cetraspora pellucida]